MTSTSQYNYSLNEARQIAVNRLVAMVQGTDIGYSFAAAELLLKTDLQDDEDDFICDDCADAEIFNSADVSTNDDETECFLGIRNCPICATFGLGIRNCPICATFGPSFLRISIPE